VDRLPAGATAKQAAALNRFNAAQKLFDQRKHAEALALFQNVYAETKSPNARLMAARCLLALGRTADGYDELYATVREAATRAESEPKYARTRDAAAAELGILEPKIGKIVIALSEPGATVSLNDVKLGPERLGVPMAMVPGPASIVATRPDGTSVRRQERVEAAETKTITLVFPSAAGAPGGLPAPPQPPAQAVSGPVRTGGGVRVAGIVIAGLGAAGMGIFGVTDALAQSKYDTLQSACGNTRCTDPKYAEVVDSGKRLQLVSNVSVIAGAVALGVGGAMILFGGPSLKPSPKTSALFHASISFSPEGARIGYESAF
jgi:hypothetical protein